MRYDTIPVTSDENNPVTRVPAVEVQSPTGSLDVDSLFEGDDDADPFAGLYGDPSEESLPNNENTASVPTAGNQNPDLAGLGKDLLAGYDTWKDGEADFDPQDDPLHYILYDAPELILGAIVAGGIAYKGVQGMGSLGSSQSSTEKSTTTTQPRLSLENRPYRVFVSHSWKYSEQRERVEEFLDSEERLDWQNFSVPEDEPLDFEDANDLRQQLYRQVGQANVVVVISGMYVSHSEWIEEEIEIAQHFEKPIIGVQPHGNERLPKSVRNAADEVVGWQQRSIVNAIARHG